ncbi:MAG: hypothetical protein U1E77_18025 [Inhella sp.]
MAHGGGGERGEGAPSSNVEFHRSFGEENLRPESSDIPRTAPFQESASKRSSDRNALFLLDDPYPEVVALRRARGKGDYAAARALTQSCVTAIASINFAEDGSIQDVLIGREGQSDYSKRLLARERLRQRCARFFNANLHKPEYGDTFGEAFERALHDVWDTENPTVIVKAVRELADQMQLTEATPVIYGTGQWDGEHIANVDILRAAAQLAVARATLIPDEFERDARTLSNCYRAGHCSKHIGIEQFTFIKYLERDRSEILRLAESIEATLRKGDAE